MVFDIQDVGARFYTYISSLMLVMEACAEADVALVVLDRPNPHGHHMQGPMLDPAFKSFVGFIPTPMVHGLTLGEAALMGCAEGWIEIPEHLAASDCDLPGLEPRHRLSIGHSPQSQPALIDLDRLVPVAVPV